MSVVESVQAANSDTVAAIIDSSQLHLESLRDRQDNVTTVAPLNVCVVYSYLEIFIIIF